MSDGSEIHYLNADFDLSLRPRPVRLTRPALVRQVRELSALALLGAEDGDSALLRVTVPDEFLEHLDRSGVRVPRLLDDPAHAAPSRLRPFGWNADAIELNRAHDLPVPHPPLDTVRRVNSRSFACELEPELSSGAPSGVMIASASELETILSRATPGSEWVVKAEHGNSGVANRRLSAKGLSAVDRRFVDGLLTEDDRLVVEPWLRRERDWCVVFEVPFEPTTLRIHETTGTSDGAFIGAVFETALPGELPWRDELQAMAEGVASRLGKAGYFGPVCVDAFSWHDRDRVRLRTLVDLNGRRSMSDGAWRLWRQLGEGRVFYYRFFNRRKIDLPEEQALALAALGERRFDPASRRGILPVSPLRLGALGESWRPGKLAFIFAADQRDEAFALERWFRARFES